MNNRCYRVVFNEALGSWTAVAEHVVARGKPARVRRQSAVGLAALLGSAALTAAGPLPDAATSGARAATNVGVSSITTSANIMTVTQSQAAAIQNWNSFNIGQGHKVEFKQPDANSRILNRIWDANPSQINGQITANGQVYLLNRNGILFGKDAVIDVGGLVASALNIKPDLFLNGYLSNTGPTAGSTPTFYYAGTLDAQGNLTDFDAAATATTSKATVRNEGEIKAQPGGSVMLFAPRVENAGSIRTESGQVVLAAGAKVYLAASDNTALRGVLVEVDPFADGKAEGSTVSNLALKDAMKGIFARRGNITLAAMAVNNDGLLSVTTGKTENGSIYLQARHSTQSVTVEAASAATPASVQSRAFATQGGELVTGSNSRIEADVESIDDAGVEAEAQKRFVADPADSLAVQASKYAELKELIRKQYTVTASETLKPSEVKLDGRKVLLASGSAITAPGGSVNIAAAGARIVPGGDIKSNQTFFTNTLADPAARVVMAEGARLDVSGYEDIKVDGQRNQVSASLVSNELKDAPLQRGGVLFRQTVHYNLLDAPGGKLAVADTSGVVNGKASSLQERAAAGGNVRIQSAGDVVLGQDAEIDVSGGSVRVGAADIEVTQLALGNQRVDINKASADIVYDGISTARRHVAAYTEGKAGGSLSIEARDTVVLDATLKGQTTVGTYQRTASTAPAAARFSFGDAFGGTTTDGVPVSFGRDLHVGQSMSLLKNAATFWKDALDAQVSDAASNRLSVNALRETGFGSITLRGANVVVEENSPLSLAPGGSLSLRAAGDVDIRSDVRGVGMKFSAEAGEGGTLRLAAGRSLDASGMWINDAASWRDSRTLYEGVQLIQGGTVTLAAGGTGTASQGSVVVEDGTRVDVSGGARVSHNGAVTLGNAGSIEVRGASGVSLQGASLQGMALATATQAGKGGSLSLRAPGILIGSGTTGSGVLGLTPAQLASGGFGSYTLAATRQNAQIAADTQLDLTRQVRTLDGVAGTRPTGSATSVLGTAGLLPQARRDGTNFSLSADFKETTAGLGTGVLDMGSGAHVDAGPGGSITFSAQRQLNVDGSLSAQGGSVTLALGRDLQPSTDPGVLPDRSIFVGDNARIDVSGIARVSTDAAGRRSGDVLDGGRISLEATRGYILTRGGAEFRLDGAAVTLDDATGSGSFTVASQGGSLSMASPTGILAGARVSAQAGGAGAAGGSYTLRLGAEEAGFAKDDKIQDSSGSSLERIITLGEGLLAPGGSLATQIAGAQKGDGIVTLFGSQPRAWVDAKALDDAGFDRVTLDSHDTVQIVGTTTLSAAREVSLSAGKLDVSAGALTVNTGNARLGWSGKRTDQGQESAYENLKPENPAGGNGTLTVQAGHIELWGGMAVTGAKQTTLDAQDRIDLRGIWQKLPDSAAALRDYNLGSFSTSGNLTLRATQVAPTTLSSFTLNVAPGSTGAEGILRVEGRGATPAVPLSAAGRLELVADHIQQAGVLRAPFGSIELNARKSVTLEAGSLTSASGEGALIPFGEIVNSTDWVVQPDGGAQRMLESVPTPSVALRGPVVEQAVGGRIDVSGGGDLQALEWVPGSGGSTNVLAAANTYAILPAYGSAYAPGGSGLDQIAGTQITLGAEAGVPAGTYTLLPARYAMLPGAYRVTLLSGYRDSPDSFQIRQPLGGSVVSARLSVAGTSVTGSRSFGVLVEPVSVTTQRSQFTEARASGFLEQRAAQAGSTLAHASADGGQLIVAARDALSLAGDIAMDAVADGSGKARRGGLFDLSVYGASGSAPGTLMVGGAPGTAPAGSLQVQTSQIAAVGAESVVLGGERRVDSTGVALTVSAQNVLYQDATGLADAQGKLPGEIIIAARDTLQLAPGSQIASADPDSSRPVSLQTRVSGDGALLRVAADDQVVTRSAAVGTQGTLIVGTGSQLAGVSVQTDATLDSQIASNAAATAKNFTLAAQSISIGPGGAPANGTRLDGGLLGSIAGSAEQIRLRGYDGIRFDEALSLGTSVSPVRALVLDAPSLEWTATGSGVVRITSTGLTLTNTTGNTASASAGGGSLDLVATGSSAAGKDAGVLQIAGGNVALRGFGDVRLAAQRGVLLSGVGGVQTGEAGGPVSLLVEAPRITATPGANQVLASTGAVTLAPGSGAPDDAIAMEAGGTLRVSGAGVTSSTQVGSRSGRVGMQANSGDLVLATGSLTDVSSRVTAFADGEQAARAGRIVLDAAQGSIVVQQGATLDLQGRGTQSAGSLSVNAPQGTVQIEGNLLAGVSSVGAAAGASTGRLQVDTGTLASLDELAQRTAQFEAERSIRLRQGDLELSQGQTLKAQRIGLYADAGDVRIAGTLDASGPNGGQIDLAARAAAVPGGHQGGQVELAPGAVLDASATVDGGRGGTVTLSVSAAEGVPVDAAGIVFAAGSRIDVSGQGGGADGSVTLNAPRTTDLLAYNPGSGVATKIDSTPNSVFTAPPTTTTADLAPLAPVSGSLSQATRSGAIYSATDSSVTTLVANVTTIDVVLTSNNVANSRLALNGASALLLRGPNNAALAANQLRAGASYRLRYRNASATGAYWEVQTTITPLAANGRTVIPVGGSFVTGEVVYFSVSSSNFGGLAANAFNGGVLLRAGSDASGETLALYDESSGSIDNVAAGGLVAGTSYAARVGTLGPGKALFLLSSTGAQETLRVIDSSVSGTPAENVGIRFTPSVTNTSEKVELQFNAVAAGRLYQPDGVTPVAVGSLVAGKSYTASRLADGRYVLRPVLGESFGQIAVNNVATPQLLAFSLASTSALVGSSSVKLVVNGGSAVALLDASGVALDPAALVAGKDYVASLQANGSYRLIADDALGNGVAISNAGVGVVLDGAPRVTVNAMQSYQAGTLDSSLQNRMLTESKQFEYWLPAIAAQLGSLDKGQLVLRPGLEVQSTGNLTVIQDLDFAAKAGDGTALWRYNSGAVGGSLVLRAAGNLDTTARLNDGFATPAASNGTPLSHSNGWDYTLVAGADLGAANRSAVARDSSAALKVGDLVRTGTGGITLAAAGNIDLSAPKATVYSAGRLTGSNSGDLWLPSITDTAFLTEGGGTLDIFAGSDIIGRTATSSPTAWQWRAPVSKASAARPAAWTSKFDQFGWTLGALGGGDVRVSAEGSVRELSVALPSQGVFGFDTQAVAVANSVSTRNGGNLSLRAGQDVLGGSLLVDAGRGSVVAGGSVGSSPTGKAPTLYLADTQFVVESAGDLRVDRVENASMLAQSSANVGPSVNAVSWNSLSADSALALRSAAGSVRIDTGGIPLLNASATPGLALPANVAVLALGGDIRLGGKNAELAMMPSPTGQLSLHAEGSIRDTQVSLIDADPLQLASALQPQTGSAAGRPAWAAFSEISTLYRDNGRNILSPRSSAAEGSALHAQDGQVVQIHARNGDLEDSRFTLGKPVDLSAGRDVTDLRLTVQNLRETDLSSLRAGRDLRYSIDTVNPLQVQTDASVNSVSASPRGDMRPGIRVFGPGMLEVLAGRDLDLAYSAGIQSMGPGHNAKLPDTGAAIRVVAGRPASIDAAQFAAQYLDAAAAADFLALGSAAQLDIATTKLREQFIATYLKPGSDYLAAWQAYAAAHGASASPAAADPVLFDRFRYQVMWTELSASGREGGAIAADAKANPGKYTQFDLTPEKLYGRGFKALELMGLSAPFGFDGSVRMLFSQIRTHAGGDVDVLVPGGSLDVGPTQAPQFVPSSGASAALVAEQRAAFDGWAGKLGLVANQGDSRVFVRDAINVNTSRWFAIDGGNLLGWASTGDIDAGKGSRTAVSGSSQRLDVDRASGRVTLVDGGASTGSGIATIFNKPVSKGGEVELYAPAGVINAGEAGIRAAGNLTLTPTVVGADFIVSVGSSNTPAAPAAPALALPAPTTNTSSSEKTATEAGRQSGPARERSSLLTVEVVAAGEEKPDCSTAAARDNNPACKPGGTQR